MEQPGRDTSSPWGGSPTSDTVPAEPTGPLVLGSADGLSLSTDVQQQMPQTAKPSSGTTLTGSVSTLDSGIWQSQMQTKVKDSWLKGAMWSMLFGFIIMGIPGSLMMTSGGGYYWVDEPVEVEWNAGGEYGSFQLSSAPIHDCSLSWDDGRYGDVDRFYGHDMCSGSNVGKLIMENQFESARWIPGDGSDTANGTLIVYPTSVSQPGDEVGPALGYRWNNRMSLGVQTFDGNLTPLEFEANMSQVGECHVPLTFPDGNYMSNWARQGYYNDHHYYPEYQYYGQLPNCPTMSYYVWEDIEVGTLDYESGFGEFILPNGTSAPDELYFEYEPRSNSEFVEDFMPCLSGIMGLVMFALWIRKVVSSFQGGKSNEGTGMIVGAIPAFIINMFLLAIVEMMFW